MDITYKQILEHGAMVKQLACERDVYLSHTMHDGPPLSLATSCEASGSNTSDIPDSIRLYGKDEASGVMMSWKYVLVDIAGTVSKDRCMRAMIELQGRARDQFRHIMGATAMELHKQSVTKSKHAMELSVAAAQLQEVASAVVAMAQPREVIVNPPEFDGESISTKTV